MEKEKEIKEVKEISLEVYLKETDKYFNKAIIDFGIILVVVVFTLLVG